MKKVILVLAVIKLQVLFSQDYSIKTKEIMDYIVIVENILNESEITNSTIQNDFVVIQKAWYESDRTKGQWYGETQSIWFVMGREKKYKLMNDIESRIFTVGNRYNWLGDDREIENKDELYNIYIKINETDNRIGFMVRNDLWYYQFSGVIERKTNGRISIRINNDEAYMND